MANSADELIVMIGKCKDIREVIKNNEKDFSNITVKDLLNKFLLEKNLKISEVEKKSGQSEYVYKIFNGARKASRDVLISIAFGMELTVAETQELLKTGLFAPLSPYHKRDIVFIYGLQNKRSIFEVKAMLEEVGEIYTSH